MIRMPTSSKCHVCMTGLDALVYAAYRPVDCCIPGICLRQHNRKIMLDKACKGSRKRQLYTGSSLDRRL